MWALREDSLALHHTPHREPSVLPWARSPLCSPGMPGLSPQFLCGASMKTWIFPLPLPGHDHTHSHTETLVCLMDCRASGCIHKRHQAILLYSCVGARSPGTPPVRVPEAQQVTGTPGDFGNHPWRSVWDRGLLPAVVNTGAWLRSCPENSPHKTGRGCLQESDAGSHSGPENSVPEAPPCRAGQVRAERPLLARLLHAGLAHGPTSTRVLGPEESKGEALCAEGGNSR